MIEHVGNVITQFDKGVIFSNFKTRSDGFGSLKKCTSLEKATDACIFVIKKCTKTVKIEINFECGFSQGQSVTLKAEMSEFLAG